MGGGSDRLGQIPNFDRFYFYFEGFPYIVHIYYLLIFECIFNFLIN